LHIEIIKLLTSPGKAAAGVTVGVGSPTTPPNASCPTPRATSVNDGEPLDSAEGYESPAGAAAAAGLSAVLPLRFPSERQGPQLSDGASPKGLGLMSVDGIAALRPWAEMVAFLHDGLEALGRQGVPHVVTKCLMKQLLGFVDVQVGSGAVVRRVSAPSDLSVRVLL